MSGSRNAEWALPSLCELHHRIMGAPHGVASHRPCTKCMCCGVALLQQATSDHFVLVGSERPTYKRAGQVVVGDTLWMSVAGAPKLVPASVIRTHIVSNTGLYAPMTLSGSIIVNNIAASVHR